MISNSAYGLVGYHLSRLNKRDIRPSPHRITVYYPNHFMSNKSDIRWSWRHVHRISLFHTSDIRWSWRHVIIMCVLFGCSSCDEQLDWTNVMQLLNVPTHRTKMLLLLLLLLYLLLLFTNIENGSDKLVIQFGNGRISLLFSLAKMISNSAYGLVGYHLSRLNKRDIRPSPHRITVYYPNHFMSNKSDIRWSWRHVHRISLFHTSDIRWSWRHVIIMCVLFNMCACVVCVKWTFNYKAK
jgi:hypothetical protein